MEFITDRTLADVQRWKELHDKGFAAMSEAERSEWLGEMKGRYAHTDMNRVENAIKTLAARLTEFGYTVPTPSAKTDWSTSNVPYKTDFNRCFRNIKVLREAIALPEGTPVVPSVASNLDYQLANDLEKILLAVDQVTTRLSQSWYYSGDIFSGEV